MIDATPHTLDSHATVPPPGAINLAPGLTREFLLHHGVCPRAIDHNGNLLTAATSTHLPSALLDLRALYERETHIELVSRAELEQLIERATTRSERSIELARSSDSTDTLATDVRDLANQPPVIRYVNLLVRDAYDAGASDIHLEATRAGLAVRFRIDGVLNPATEPATALNQAVLSRIKLLAELDIAERRRPQDGRIRVRLETRELDLRVSTVPTMYGESVVLRLLDHGGRPITLEQLGMPAHVLETVAHVSAKPNGMLLVTGPTGSGKTTTLYAALQRRATTTQKVITVEDPIEYALHGITQVPVHRQSGITFASALRAILRQDPDVVMIGEMRDTETAEIAVQAAMTGHLVFSTLHTNDALSAIPRLRDLGVPSYLLATSLDAVLAQRLVRRACDRCETRGCDACRGTGFRGRIGVFEILHVDDSLRDLIAEAAPNADLRRCVERCGHTTLAEDARAKASIGLTTTAEVLRVIQA